ncbi:MAG: pilin [Candidatus Falkowbacteria bacterium]
MLKRKSFSVLSKALFLVAAFFVLAVIFQWQANTVLAVVDPFGGQYNNVNAEIGLSATNPTILAAKIINWFLGFLGIIAVGLILYAGFLWMTSGGEVQKIETAKKILKNAVIGLIIILASWGIALYILNFLTNKTGGQNAGGGGGGGGGLSAFGNGIIEYVYPVPNQMDVARNTAIIVKFREDVKPDTICNELDANGLCSDSSLNFKNVRIFTSAAGDTCDSATSPSTSSCKISNIWDVKVNSIDKQTFVFKSTVYLGSPSERIWHTVYLTKDIKKADGSKAFSDLATKSDTSWSFEVSTRLDFEPPQVEQGGIFPFPDAARDMSNISVPATQATGSIRVLNEPKKAKNSYADNFQSVASPGISTVSLDKSCLANGPAVVVMYEYPLNSGKLAPNLQINESSIGNGTIDVNKNIITFPYCNIRLILDSPVITGNSWNFDLHPNIIADYVSIAGEKYIASTTYNEAANTFAASANSTNTAASLTNLINANNPLVDATSAGDKITVNAKIANGSGNQIKITTNGTSFSVSGLAGGKDRQESIEPRNSPDQPRNSVIRVDFNEAINPLYISGPSTQVYNYIRVVNNSTTATSSGNSCHSNNECLSYECVGGSCVGDYLAGKFKVSNIFRTVEFLSNVECGVNACGETMYCLPENSNLRVELVAATLAPCASNAICVDKAPYQYCKNSICNNSSTPAINFPGAKKPVNGIVDTADNSLDGNRDKNAIGSTSDWYIERRPTPPLYPDNSSGSGDNYRWSFMIDNRILIEEPKITNTTPVHRGTVLLMSKNVEFDFNRLMMSQSLTSGGISIGSEASSTRHRLVNLMSYGNPIGYWIANKGFDDEPKDGFFDTTQGFIEHADFAASSTYRGQVGSGVKDIYQNCFKPSGTTIGWSGSCAAVSPNSSCCGSSTSASVIAATSCAAIK